MLTPPAQAEKKKLEQAAGVLPETADVNAAAAASTAVAAAVADSSRPHDKNANEEARKVKGPVEVVKNWAMKGLTPADQEIKTVFDKKEAEALKAADTIRGPVVEVKETVEKVKEEGKKKGWFW